MWIWHGEQSQSIRSCKEAQQWYSSQASGSYFKHLNDLVKSLADKEKLKSFGLGEMPVGYTPAKMRSDELMLAEDDAKAATVGTFTLNLMSRRAWSLAWHTLGMPGLFARLLIPEEVESTLLHMQRVREAYAKIPDLTKWHSGKRCSDDLL